MNRQMGLCLFLSVFFFFVGLGYALAQEPTSEPTLPPSAPYEVTVSGIKDTCATVSWSPVATAKQYTVWVDGQRWTGSSYPGAEIKGLQPYTEYTVYVTASNDAGESGPSSSVVFRTLPPVPTAPEKPVISEVTDTKTTILWQPIPAWQFIQQYRIYVDGQPVADINPQAGMQAAELTNLEPGIHYVTVSGINENQEGPLSLPAKFTIQTVSAPSGLMIANRCNDRVLLTWDTIPDADKYKVYIDGNLAGETTKNYYLIEGLASDMTYRVSVSGVLGDGNESVQAILDVKTLSEPSPVSIANAMSSAYDYIPDVLPGLVIVFAIGAAFAIARAGKYSLGTRVLFRR